MRTTSSLQGRQDTPRESRLPWRVRLLLVFAIPLVVALAPLLLLLYSLYSAGLLVAIWLTWLPRGRDVLFVHSDSPMWIDEVRAHLLPRLQRRAVVLNWSQRARWPRGLATAAFHHFGGGREFNPMAVVFRPFRRARVFRFWKPFREAKHGNRAPLERTTRELFEALGID